MDILLSSKPRYVRCIRERRKFVELRQQFLLDREIGTIFVYASFPIKRICGFFLPRTICSLPIAELWEQTRSFFCVEEDEFLK